MELIFVHGETKGMRVDAEKQFIDLVAGEIASAVCEALGYWMAEIETTLAAQGTSAEEKLEKVHRIVAAYKAKANKRELHRRQPVSSAQARRASVGDAI
jgi:aminoglycoside phosphotransferase family enzyme